MANLLSVRMRLRRIKIESSEVSVPLSAETLIPNPDGSGTQKIDIEKLQKVALELGRDPSTIWKIESEPEIILHPEQSSAS